MRKILTIVALLLVSSLAAAAGDYDGIWALDVPANTDYFSIHQQSNIMVVANLDNSLDGGGWDAYKGVLNGDTVVADLLVSTESGGRISIQIIFASPSHATVKMIACIPDKGTLCPWPVGTQYPMIRVF